MTDDQRNRKRTRDDSRVPPHNLDAEESLLGAALLSRDVADMLVSTLATSDFYKAAHQHVAHAIASVHSSGAGVDAVTVADDLRRTGLLDEIGGPDFLLRLQNATPAVSNAGRYAQIVRETSTLRRLLHATGQIADLAYHEGDPGETVARAIELLTDVGTVVNTETLSSLDVIDIEALLATDLRPETPSLLVRSDGSGLLYVGKMHVLQAEPSAGKTWIALAACLEVLRMGGTVIYLDWEDTALGILGRLLALGATPDEIARFGYINPTGRFGLAERTRLGAMLDDLNPDLVVIDSVGEALSRDGLNEDVASDVIEWANRVPRWIARTGAAVLMADHVAKDPEQRGRWARGSGAKLGLVDGASYQVKVGTAFSRHREGTVRMIVAKDRPGGVGAIGETAAVITITPHAAGERVVLRIDPHTAELAPTDRWKPTKIMEQLSRAVETSTVPLTATALRFMSGSSKPHLVKEAIGYLLSGGYLIESTGRPKTIRLVKPYREDGTPPPEPPEPSSLFDEEPGPTEADYHELYSDPDYLDRLNHHERTDP